MQKNQPRTMVKKRRDGGIMVWSPRGARAGRRERNTAFYEGDTLVSLFKLTWPSAEGLSEHAEVAESRG